MEKKEAEDGENDEKNHQSARIQRAGVLKTKEQRRCLNSLNVNGQKNGGATKFKCFRRVYNGGLDIVQRYEWMSTQKNLDYIS